MRVISKSEAGSYRDYGDVDMKVLRRDANAAHEFFYGMHKVNNARCVFSVIDDGRMVPPGTETSDAFIRRSLKTVKDDKGDFPVLLMYEDSVRNGPRELGVLALVEEIRIRDGYLNIYGSRGGRFVTYRYKIRENADSFRYPRPVPEGQPRLEDYGTPREMPKRNVPKPVAKPVPTTKPAKKKTVQKASKPSVNGRTYEVRVGGTVRGSFTSKSKAETHKKELKSKGLPAKIVVVGY